MKVLFTTSVFEYLEKVEALLLQKEASNHLMLGLLDYFKTTISKDVNFGYIESNGEVIYAFMQTPPNHWILADVDQLDETIITNLATLLYKNIMKVSGIQGPTSFVERFIERWQRDRKVKAIFQKSEWIYRLDQIQVTPSEQGQLVLATKRDHALLKSWIIQFGKEAKEPMTEIKADQLATKYIENKSIYLWEVNGIPVSMANQSMGTKNIASINTVFTPDEFKRRGFATNTVAALSQKLLDEGYRSCCLYTDKENPTSNHIYQHIGYEMVGSSVVYTFK